MTILADPEACADQKSILIGDTLLGVAEDMVRDSSVRIVGALGMEPASSSSPETPENLNRRRGREKDFQHDIGAVPNSRRSARHGFSIIGRWTPRPYLGLFLLSLSRLSTPGSQQKAGLQAHAILDRRNTGLLHNVEEVAYFSNSGRSPECYIIVYI